MLKESVISALMNKAVVGQRLPPVASVCHWGQSNSNLFHSSVCSHRPGCRCPSGKRRAAALGCLLLCRRSSLSVAPSVCKTSVKQTQLVHFHLTSLLLKACFGVRHCLQDVVLQLCCQCFPSVRTWLWISEALLARWISRTSVLSSMPLPRISVCRSLQYSLWPQEGWNCHDHIPKPFFFNKKTKSTLTWFRIWLAFLILSSSGVSSSPMPDKPRPFTSCSRSFLYSFCKETKRERWRHARVWMCVSVCIWNLVQQTASMSCCQVSWRLVHVHHGFSFHVLLIFSAIFMLKERERQRDIRMSDDV